ncbi:hypothetical protein SAMN05444920_1396 [Nonomuraea solani]|uniref:PknH-like extracellular domain-containing protein n=1 Tax=Nonomuraea solani TaxID=1144553 RepID=A0A1H6F069_9ACTN|nr:hypothetical protein [Nonomuraea solani]SEH03547.1 hypothetical protein SAMN05444920_1396 [Nonomuraea solani]
MNSARPWPTLVVASALTLVCAVAAGVAGSAAGTELTRGPSTAELHEAARREVADRWRTWPTGRIFPATLPYSAEQGGQERASRIGISPQTACGDSVDAKAVRALSGAGCKGVLRATYIDALRGVLVTIGVVALRDELGAVRAKSAFVRMGADVGVDDGKPAPGLRPLAFRDTVSDRFGPAVRQSGSVRQAGPYLVLTTAGQVDGRPADAAAEPRPAIFAFAGEISEHVLTGLSTPKMPDCASPEWQC